MSFKRQPTLKEWYRVFAENGHARRRFEGGKFYPFTKLSVGDKLHVPFQANKGDLVWSKNSNGLK